MEPEFPSSKPSTIFDSCALPRPTFAMARSVKDAGKGDFGKESCTGVIANPAGATAAVALMLAAHRKAGTWTKRVTLHIALTQFSRSKFTEGGLPAEKITVKPNFIAPDPGAKSDLGEGAVFVGRFWPEKGVATLLHAWGKLGTRIPLRILGDGPLRPELERLAADLNLSNVSFMGQVGSDVAQAAIKSARVLIFPSENYENFPMTILESMSCGTPVVCSRLGSMQEIVADKVTGLHFSPGNSEDLAEKVAWAWDHCAEIKDMGRAARLEYEQKYTAENNYATLMSIYQQAISYAA